MAVLESGMEKQADLTLMSWEEVTPGQNVIAAKTENKRLKRLNFLHRFNRQLQIIQSKEVVNKVFNNPYSLCVALWHYGPNKGPTNKSSGSIP